MKITKEFCEGVVSGFLTEIVYNKSGIQPRARIMNAIGRIENDIDYSDISDTHAGLSAPKMKALGKMQDMLIGDRRAPSGDRRGESRGVGGERRQAGLLRPYYRPVIGGGAGRSSDNPKDFTAGFAKR